MSSIQLADGSEVPTRAVDALHGLEQYWPGATFEKARPVIVAKVMEALDLIPETASVPQVAGRVENSRPCEIALKGGGSIQVPNGYGVRADYRGFNRQYRGRPTSWRVEDGSGTVLVVVPEKVMLFAKGGVELEPLWDGKQ